MAGHFVPFRELEVDGLLTDAKGKRVGLHCRILFPTAGHESVSIELSIPHTALPVKFLNGPCTFAGTASGPLGSVEICLNDIYIREHTEELIYPTQWGRSVVDLLSIGELSLTVSRDYDRCADEQLVTVHTTNPRLTQAMRKLGRGALSDTHPIFSTPLAELGTVTFYRYWGCHFDHEKDVFSGAAGTSATVALNDPVTDIKAVVAKFDRLLLVLSLLSRQSVLPRSVHYCAGGLSYYSRAYPIADLRPPYIPAEPGDYSVALHDVESVLSKAVAAALQKLDVEWESIRLLVFALAPAVSQSTGEQFMALMSGFESIVVPSPPPDEASKRTDTELIDALESLKPHRTTAFAERVEGFQDKIRAGPTKNFKQRMRVLFGSQSLFVADLWPMTGKKRQPGLIDLRDQLAHMGPRSVNPQSLAIALWHLRIHAERYCFEKLSVPLSQTNNCPKKLGLDNWYSKPTWERARSDAIV